PFRAVPEPERALPPRRTVRGGAGFVNIRAATHDDLQTIRELWQALEDETEQPEFAREKWEEELVDTDRRLREAVIFLAEEEGETIGYAAVDYRRPRVAELQSLYVRPARRRKGVARALMRQASAAARGRGYDHVMLGVGS